MADINDVLTGTAEGLSNVTKEAKGATEAVKQQNTEVAKSVMAWGAAGSAASAALGSLSAGLGKTNPLLGSLLAGVQKMIPLFTGMGQAAQAAGVAMKTAMASTGIGLLLVALGEAVNFLVSMKTKADEAKASMDKIADGIASTLGLEAWKRANDLQKELVGRYGLMDKALQDIAEIGAKGGDSLTDAYRRLNDLLEKTPNLTERQKELSVAIFNDKVNALKEEQRAQAAADEEAKTADKERAEAAKRRAAQLQAERDKITALFEKTTDSVKNFAKLELKDLNLDVNWDELINIDDLDASLEQSAELLSEWHISMMSQQEQEITAIEAKGMAFKQAGIDEVEVQRWVDEEKAKINDKYREEEEQKEKEAQQKRINNMTATADAFANLFDGLAQLLESDEKNNKKNAKKIKALKIATATIDMLSGAVKAYASAQELGPPLGPIVGAVNAGATIAMGIANINKIKNSDVESGSGATASVTPSVAPQQTYIANPTSNQDVVDAVNNNTSVTSSVQTVLVVDDYKKVADQANRVQVQSSF